MFFLGGFLVFGKFLESLVKFLEILGNLGSLGSFLGKVLGSLCEVGKLLEVKSLGIRRTLECIVIYIEDKYFQDDTDINFLWRNFTC